MASNKLVVAAIDFGTTYSGWAFSFKHDFDREPTKISAKQWTGGQLVSLKGPTCALIKPDGKTLHAFAFEAETKYAELAEQEQHKKWYYFKRFKMRLWNQEINRNTTLEDETGKKLPATTVFSLVIKHLKDDMLKTCGKQITGDGGIAAKDIHWVLTVPAIWDDAAKQFMREAAEMGGIERSHLTIALEPEAASLFCRHLPVEKSGKQASLASFGQGKCYMVLDAGGGTVDITVHEVTRNGKIKEIDKCSGGAWGGTMVDKAFMQFLGKVAGDHVVAKFKEEHMEDYIDLLRDFELKKRSISDESDGLITMRCPVAFGELVKSMRNQAFGDLIKSAGYGEKIKQSGDKLRIDAEVFRGFFKPAMETSSNHVKDLLRKPCNKNISAIVMVGGFSESPLLQDEIHKASLGKTLIVPDEAGLAVLKGAVIYGHSPEEITQRVSKLTYGIAISIPFDESKHPWSHRVVRKNGDIKCDHIFDKHVEVGQTLTVGEAQRVATYCPANEDDTHVYIKLYVSAERNPSYVDRPGCRQVGHLDVPLGGYGKSRSVETMMIFGGTEIEVECTEKATGNKHTVKIDFLT